MSSGVRRLLGQPVWVGALCVGTVDDLVIGADLGAVLGFVVVTRAKRRCFLPWVAAQTAPRGIHANTAATLLGEVELDYYLESGVRLSRLIGLSVTDERGLDGDSVADVVASSDGRVRELRRSNGHGTYGTPIENTRIRWRAGRLLELRALPQPPSNRSSSPPAAGPRSSVEAELLTA